MRKELEDLIFIGNLQETYKLFGKNWTLRTLTTDEQLQVTLTTRDYDNLSRLNGIRIATLARSIVQYDTLELKDVNEKLEWLGKLQQPIIELVFTKYQELQKKQDESLRDMDNDIKN